MIKPEVDPGEGFQFENVEGLQRGRTKLPHHVRRGLERLVRDAVTKQVVINGHYRIPVLWGLGQNGLHRRGDDAIWIGQDRHAYLGTRYELLHGYGLPKLFGDRRDALVALHAAATGAIDAALQREALLRDAALLS